MRKRNTILALVAAGLLTVVAFTPALPEGLQCSDYPNLDRCPIYGGYGNPEGPNERGVDLRADALCFSNICSA